MANVFQFRSYLNLFFSWFASSFARGLFVYSQASRSREVVTCRNSGNMRLPRQPNPPPRLDERMTSGQASTSTPCFTGSRGTHERRQYQRRNHRRRSSAKKLRARIAAVLKISNHGSILERRAHRTRNVNSPGRVGKYLASPIATGDPLCPRASSIRNLTRRTHKGIRSRRRSIIRQPGSQARLPWV